MAASTDRVAAIQLDFKPHHLPTPAAVDGNKNPKTAEAQQHPVASLVPHQPVSIDVFADGDIPLEWRSLVAKKDPFVFQGNWEIDLQLSEKCDHIFAALGVGAIKRAFLRTYKTKVTIEIVTPSENVPPSAADSAIGFHLVTTLPMGHTKEATIPASGEFTQYDPDTKAEWTNVCCFNEGILKQRRTSSLGVMYDVRCIFDSDPEDRVKDAKQLMLFKWTFTGKDGKRLTSNRWLRKVPNV